MKLLTFDDVCTAICLSGTYVFWKIFFDLGANDGSSVAYFVEKSSRRDAYKTDAFEDGSFREQATKLTSGSSQDSWEVHVFEANKKYTEKLVAQRNLYLASNVVKSYMLYNGTAVSTYNGFINFTFDHIPGGDAGSTTMAESNSALGAINTVIAIDIVSVFRNLQIVENDFVAIKMDIEGAEYMVVKHMIMNGLIPLIDKFAIEWHHENHYVFGLKKGQNDPERSRIHDKYLHHYHTLLWMFKGSGFENILSTWT